MFLFCRIKQLKTFIKMHNVLRSQWDRRTDKMMWQLFQSLTEALLFLRLAANVWRKEKGDILFIPQTVDQGSLCSFPSWRPGSFLTLPCCFTLAEMPFSSHSSLLLYLALFNYIYFLLHMLWKPQNPYAALILSRMLLGLIVDTGYFQLYPQPFPESHNHSLSTSLSFSAFSL